MTGRTVGTTAIDYHPPFGAVFAGDVMKKLLIALFVLSFFSNFAIAFDRDVCAGNVEKLIKIAKDADDVLESIREGADAYEIHRVYTAVDDIGVQLDKTKTECGVPSYCSVI